MVVTRAWLRSPTSIGWAATLLGLGVGAGLLVSIAGPRVAALVIGGVLALVGVAVAPGVVFALYLLIPFYKGGLQPYVPIDLTLILAGLNALQLVPLMLHPPKGNVSRIGVALWVGLAVLILVGVFYAPDQRLALSHAVTFWLLLFGALTAGALRVGSDRRYVAQVLWTFFGIGVITTLFGITSLSDTARLTVLGSNTINVALAALFVPILGVTFVARQGPVWVRLATIVLIPAALLVSLATGSRGPVLVLLLLAIAAAVRAAPRLRSANRPRTLAIAALALAILVVVSLASTDLPVLSANRFAVFGDFIQSALAGDQVAAATADTSSTARLTFFGAAVTMFDERPILGYGTAGFEAMSQTLLGHVEAYPHNAVLQFAAEFGLVGLGLLLTLVVVTLARELPDWARPVRLLLIFFLLEALVSGDIFADRTTWGLVVLCLLIEVPVSRALEVDAVDEAQQPTVTAPRPASA
jgi:O-antigen ligase